MKAAIVEAPGKIVIRDLPVPKPNPYQALVRMEVTGVCSATDRKLSLGLKPFAPSYPCLLGHEGVGTVVETGGRVVNFKVGDRVLRPCGIYPGQEMQGISSAWGSFCEFALVTDLEAWKDQEPAGEHSRFGYARMQKKVPAHWTTDAACMLITWKETFSSLQQGGAMEGRAVAVLGDGAVGLSFAAWSHALGAASVEVVGHRAFRLERARILGASVTRNLRAGDTFEGGRDFDIIVDTLGTDEAVATSLPRLRNDGKFLIYGMDSTFETHFDRSTAPQRWSYVQANPDEAGVHDEVLRRLDKKPFDPATWITFRGGIENLSKAFTHLESPESVKAVITFHET